MQAGQNQQITQLLDAVRHGDREARSRLWEAVFLELHRIAQAHMAHEAPGRTLQPTALVNEAYLRLFGDNNHPTPSFENRRHFFAAAARAMRRILVDYARSRKSLKRGCAGDPGSTEGAPSRAKRVPLDSCVSSSREWDDPLELLALDEAMTKLEAEDGDLAHVVELRFFAGIGVEETADIMEIAPRTVEKYWRAARAWLHESLSD